MLSALLIEVLLRIFVQRGKFVFEFCVVGSLVFGGEAGP